MKTISTYMAFLSLPFFMFISASAQDCATTQPQLSACDNIVQNFNSGAGGFHGVNLAHTSSSFSTTLSDAVSPATLSIISPAYYKMYEMPNTITAGYKLGVGSKLTVTSITLQVLDASSSDAVIASCLRPVEITANTSICMSVYSTAIKPGMMLKYKFVFTVSIDNGGNNSQNSFSVDDFSIASGMNAPLPVKFSFFEAKKLGSQVVLNWRTEMEENAGRFEVERSMDGRNFHSIGTMPATGAGSYQFTDNRPMKECYYRIKSVDLDGRQGFTHVIRMSGEHASTPCRAFFSNPGMITVQHEIATAGMMIKLSTAEGRVLRTLPVLPGTQLTRIPAADLRPGLIIVQIERKHAEMETIKLIRN